LRGPALAATLLLATVTATVQAAERTPLDGDNTWLATGGELRLRYEGFNNNLWGSAEAPDDGYLLRRVMPYADLHAGSFRAFVQPIAASADGIRPSAGPVDQTRTDLLQGFADVTVAAGDGNALTLRAGREILSFGTERLVGKRYGTNVPLAFDGVHATVRGGDTTLDLFAARPVRAGQGSFDDRSTRGKQLWGAYATVTGFDFYYLGYTNRQARFDAAGGHERRHSLGVRSFGSAGDWHWNVEAIGQFGQLADKKIRAWTVGSEAGRRFAGVALQPDLTVRLNVVSGTRHRNGDTLGTFNALFPKAKYFGELSPVGPYNIVNFNPGISVHLGDTVSAGLNSQFYWRYAKADGVYDVPGNLLRAAGSARSRFIGKQLEATVAWQAMPELELSASLSAFKAGAFLRETGPARSIGMLGLEAGFSF
jgi:hypothetical protein